MLLWIVEHPGYLVDIPSSESVRTDSLDNPGSWYPIPRLSKSTLITAIFYSQHLTHGRMEPVRFFKLLRLLTAVSMNCQFELPVKRARSNREELFLDLLLIKSNSLSKNSIKSAVCSASWGISPVLDKHLDTTSDTMTQYLSSRMGIHTSEWWDIHVFMWGNA